ncbi:MAG: TRAP transporter small permease [Microbacterium sp.]
MPERRLAWLGWIDRFNVVLAVIGGLATVALMINVIADVIGRSLFNHPFPSTLELTQFVWMPILIGCGLGYALQRGEHIRVNLLTSPTSPRTQRIVEIIALTFTLLIVASLVYFTALRALQGTERAEAAVGNPWILVWPVRWVVVIGLIGLLLQTLAEIVRAWTVADFVEEDEVALALEQESSAYELLDAAAREEASDTPQRKEAGAR